MEQKQEIKFDFHKEADKLYLEIIRKLQKQEPNFSNKIKGENESKNF